MGLSQRSTAAIVQSAPVRRRKAKTSLKSSTIAIYASIFALVIVIVGLGYHEPQQESTVANASAATVDTSTQVGIKTSVSDIVATAIAADVAQTANLSVAPNVANLAVSAQIQSEVSQSSTSSVISKSQLTGSGGEERTDTISYTVVDGDTMASIAAKFGISKQTLQWANNTTSSSVSVGTALKIPPVDGVIYTVKSGDTIDSIAKKYDVDRTRLVLFNDLDLGGLTPGAQIILPAGILPSNERPGYVQQPIYVDSSAGYSSVKFLYRVPYGVSSPGNTGVQGQCTWYVWDRRVKLGYRMPSGAVLGNAEAWARSLGHLGYSINYGKPSVGAIMQNRGGYGGMGHVAFVESIAENGDVTISEMNYGMRSYIVTQRTISAGQAASLAYAYIQ